MTVAFAGLGYFSIWLAGKMHILDNRGEVWKTIIVLVPFLAASMVAISRIMDARHHPFDVLSSSILGMFLAWVSYRQYFPSIYNTQNKGYAYPIRSWGTETPPPPGPAFVRAPDEEDGGRVFGDKPGRALASGVPVVGGGESPEQRRRQYLEEQETLERRRRRAHEFDNAYIGNQPEPSLPPTPTISGQRDYGAGSTFEMRDQKDMKTAYQPYSSSSTGPPAQGAHSTDSNESEDYRWGIAAATSALGGDKLAYTPIVEEFDQSTTAPNKTMESIDSGFVQVQPAPRQVELRDGARSS